MGIIIGLMYQRPRKPVSQSIYTDRGTHLGWSEIRIDTNKLTRGIIMHILDTMMLKITHSSSFRTRMYFQFYMVVSPTTARGLNTPDMSAPIPFHFMNCLEQPEHMVLSLHRRDSDSEYAMHLNSDKIIDRMADSILTSYHLRLYHILFGHAPLLNTYKIRPDFSIDHFIIRYHLAPHFSTPDGLGQFRLDRNVSDLQIYDTGSKCEMAWPGELYFHGTGPCGLSGYKLTELTLSRALEYLAYQLNRHFDSSYPHPRYTRDKSSTVTLRLFMILGDTMHPSKQLCNIPAPKSITQPAVIDLESKFYTEPWVKSSIREIQSEVANLFSTRPIPNYLDPNADLEHMKDLMDLRDLKHGLYVDSYLLRYSYWHPIGFDVRSWIREWLAKESKSNI